MGNERKESNQEAGQRQGNRWLGILMVIGGVVAFAAPFQATVFVNVLIGIVLLAASGILLATLIVSDEGFWPRVGHLAVAAINFFVGVFFLVRPEEALSLLTLVIIGYLFVFGAIRIFGGFMIMPLSDRDGYLMVAAGALSVMIAIVFSVRYPDTSTVVLGIGAGATLILEGLTMLGFRVGRNWFSRDR